MTDTEVLDAKEWAAAFAKAQAEFPPIHKGKTVDTGSFSYKYADLPSILDAVNPILKDNGLAIGQAVMSDDGKVGVETRIYHTSGHVEVFGPVYLNAGGDARSAGSAITYARRYSLCAALGIATDEDDDGGAASPRPERANNQRTPVTTTDPHCPACLAINGELVSVSRFEVGEGERKPYWKCTKQAECAGAKPDKNGRKWGWSGWHDAFAASAEEWLVKNGYEGSVIVEEPAESPGDWLAIAVKAFGKWTVEQRRGAYKAVMEDLAYERLTSMERAKAVYEGMAAAFYLEFPDESPF